MIRCSAPRRSPILPQGRHKIESRMTPTLRPMNLGEILDRTFQIYRSRFFRFVGIAAIPAAATVAVEVIGHWLFSGIQPNWTEVFAGLSFGDLGAMLAYYHFTLFFQLMTWPLFIEATSRTILEGAQSSFIGSDYWKRKKCWKGDVGLSTLFLLLTLVLPEVATFGLFVGIVYPWSLLVHDDGSSMHALLPTIQIISLLLGWSAIGWMSARFALAFPARVLERLQVRKALRRGRLLSRNGRLQLIAAWLMPAIFGWVLFLFTRFVLASLRASCFIDGDLILIRVLGIGAWNLGCVPSPIVESLRVASDVVISAILAPIYPIAVTLFYYDQRIRKEGFDIEHRMAAAGMIPTESSPHAMPVAPSMPEELNA